MRFSCESCGAQYMISDEKVGPNGVKVRCKKCGNVIPVKAASPVTLEAAASPAGVAPAASAEVAAAPAANGESGAAPGGDLAGELDRDVDEAFQNVLGGGSAGIAAEARNAVAAVAPGNDWYLAMNERQVGPVAATTVKTHWDAGEIGPETLAWRPGLNDWVPLASIPEMAQFLVTAARGTGAGARTGSSAFPDGHASASAAAPGLVNGSAGTLSNGTNGAANGHDGGWQPSAGSALAALASQEISWLERPADAAAVAPVPQAKSGSLLDRMNLPEGGVDPTALLPLPMKGLDQTSEATLKPKASSASEPTEIRQLKKSAARSGAAVGVMVASMVAVAVGVALWLFRPVAEPPSAAPATRMAMPAPAVAPTAAPAAAPASPTTASSPATPPAAALPSATAASPAAAASPASAAATPATPAAAPGAAAATPGTPAAAPDVRPSPGTEAVASAPPPASPAETAPATPQPPPERTAAAASKTSPAKDRATAAARRRAARAERLAVARAAASKAAPRASAAERAPDRASGASRAALAAASPVAPAAAEPVRRKASGDPLLDVGGDDELEKELAGGKPKRSVYVPPAIGSGLPDSVSVSQINEAVVGQKAALLRCIEQQKAADPAARGILKLRWVISGDGTARDMRIESNEFAKQPIGPCISDVVKAIRFPRSRTTGQEVVFPFKF